MKQNKFIFGITGGSGTGKTTVSEMFRSLGADVIDCDRVSRIVTDKGSPCLKEIEAEFGSNIIDGSGVLNRKRLGQIVFSDPGKLDILNRITHKYIYEYVIKSIEKSDKEFIGIDGAVLIGSGIDDLCCSMVSVLSDTDKRVQRIMKRDNISIESAKNRINSQKIDNFYIENSDFLIYNNSTTDVLEREVKEVWIKLNEKKIKKEQEAVL